LPEVAAEGWMKEFQLAKRAGKTNQLTEARKNSSSRFFIPH
jgi:hypothetical protein